MSIFARIADTAPVISSTVSPRTRSAIRKAPICDGVASPDIIMSKASAASSRVSAAPVATLPISSLKLLILRSRGQAAGRRPLRDIPVAGQIEEILQQDVAVLGGDAFGMELHAVHRQLAVRRGP